MKIGNIAPVVAAAILFGVLASPSAWTATAWVSGKVTRVLVHGSDVFGGCMAQLSVNPQSLLPACAAGWVTFSCTGDFTDTVRAFRMVDQAQLALATDKTVEVIVDDSRRHNGYCFATRIDVVK